MFIMKCLSDYQTSYRHDKKDKRNLLMWFYLFHFPNRIKHQSWCTRGIVISVFWQETIYHICIYIQTCIFIIFFTSWTGRNTRYIFCVTKCNIRLRVSIQEPTHLINPLAIVCWILGKYNRWYMYESINVLKASFDEEACLAMI